MAINMNLLENNPINMYIKCPEVGNLGNLETTDKSSIVNAINEVNSHADTNTTNIAANTSAIGTLSNLTTTEKGTLVGAINENTNEISEVKADLGDIIQATRNLWYHGDVSIDSTGYSQFLLENPLAAGTYTFSCECTSTYTGQTYSVVRFSRSQNASALPSTDFIADVQITHDGTRQSTTFTISETAYSVRFMSGANLSTSSGQTSEWENIQVESGSSATGYIKPVTAVDWLALRAEGFITSDTIATTYDDLNNFPSNSIIGFNSTAITAGLQHSPISVGAEVLTISHAGGSGKDAIIQYCIPFNRTTDSKIYVRSQINYVWTDWTGIETNPLYVGYDLYPTGDTTDRVVEIIAVLATKGVCRLASGDFYCSALAVYEGTEIIGCGNSTRIIRLDSSSYSYMIRLRKDCKLKDVALLGSLTDITPSTEWDIWGTPAGICAIRIEGTGSDDSQRFRAEISNVSISSFAGAGIFISRTGYNPQSGCHIEGVFVRNCNAGIALGQYAEFHRITGCGFFECYYGAVNNGGNNVFENCDFSSNIQGLLMDNSSGTYSNSSHGSFVGCSFNHSDSNNGTAIELNTMIAGEMFVGCNIFYGAIILTASQGIVFSACNFGSSTPITITDGGGVQFANCVFRSGQSPVTDNRPTTTHFDNCYYLNGTAVSGTPA